jgi:glucokinase
MPSVIGVDVGGTLLRAARFAPGFALVERVEQSTDPSLGTDAVLDRLVETIRQVLPESPEELEGIGLVLPGPLDPESGVVIAPPNLPFRDVPVARILQDALGRAVYIGKDTDLAGLAEHTFGAGKGVQSMIYMTIGTGIGGGLILNGRLHTGRGQGGEIGHMVVDPDGPLCGCGSPGHLEALASGTAIARTARAMVEAGERSLIAELVDGNTSQITARVVGEAARRGDALALTIVTQAGRYIGMGIASLMAALNPDLFVLGGGVTRLGRLLFDPIHEAVREYAMHPRFYENTPIVPAQLGEDVGLFGAATLVRLRQQG